MTNTSTVVAAVRDELRPLGFKFTGQTGSREIGGVIQFANIQTSEFIDGRKATVNLGIFSKDLEQILGRENWDIHWTMSHYRLRIGEISESPSDKWWPIDPIESANCSAKEIRALVRSRVIPWFEDMHSIDDLCRRWLEGDCGGHTRGAVESYLETLRGSRGN